MPCVCDCPVWMIIVGVGGCISICCHEIQHGNRSRRPAARQPTRPIAKQPGEPAEATCSDDTVLEQKGNPLEVTDATVSETTDKTPSTCSESTEQLREQVQECTPTTEG